jgi:excisionase family DNA binding protein
MTAEPWVSVDQIAEHLGVTRDSIYRWISRRGLPVHRVGRLWKFQLSEVDEWVRTGGANEDKKMNDSTEHPPPPIRCNEGAAGREHETH